MRFLSVKLEAMSFERNSQIDARVLKHAALADVARLTVVDVLTLGDASPSELQAKLGMASNLLAHHLKVLEGAGITARRRSQSDQRRSYVTLAPGGLDAIAPATTPALEELGEARRVVFVCTANSARSQLATALWQQASAVPSASAGTHPAEQVAPGALAAAARHGLRLIDDCPRHLDDVRRAGDLVITVCDQAHEELNGIDILHWAIPDPVAVGTAAAYDVTITDLGRRVTSLATAS